MVCHLTFFHETFSLWEINCKQSLAYLYCIHISNHYKTVIYKNKYWHKHFPASSEVIFHHSSHRKLNSLPIQPIRSNLSCDQFPIWRDITFLFLYLLSSRLSYSIVINLYVLSLDFWIKNVTIYRNLSHSLGSHPFLELL